MKNYIIKTTLLLIIITVFLSCSNNNSDLNMLNSGWYYSLASMNDDITTGLNADYRPLSDLENLEKLIEDTEGFLWLKNSFKVPDNLKNSELSLLLGRITIADETYLNGDLLGSGGKFPKHFFSNWNQFRFFNIPKSLLNSDKENKLLVKVYINSEGSITGDIIFDKRDILEKKFMYQEFFNSNINILISSVLLVIGAYYLFMFFKRKKDRENLYFAVLSLGTAIYLTNFFISKVPGFSQWNLSYIFFQKIIFISVFVSGYSFVNFFREFLGIRKKIFHARIIQITTIIPILCLLLINNYKSLKIVNGYLQLLLLIPLGLSFFYIVSALFTKNKDVKVLLLGLSPFVFTIFFDLVFHQILKFNTLVYLAGFGQPLFLISILFILSGRFVKFHNEVEELNTSLEKKVLERTEDLNKANLFLGNTLTELEEKNKIAKKDMDMATSIQGRLFPKISPNTNVWSTSHVFKPMAGVSGDLYDYYLNSGELSGLTLLDVSGHGIASGLITMIANTIARRNFQSKLDKSLGEVVYDINEELIEEIDKVENYLTGIFLRFKENLVEYVNAGHVDLIHRCYRTGKVSVVTSKDSKGWFLGISDMKVKFKTLKFRVEPNDILFLYSDCLNESTNPDGEEYGVERILQSLKNIPNNSPEKILNHIMEDLYNFTKTKELTDDMTAIVVKKK